MSSNDFPIGVAQNNPLVHSVFTQDFDEQGLVPPSGYEFLITEDGKYIITEDGKYIVTES